MTLNDLKRVLTMALSSVATALRNPTETSMILVFPTVLALAFLALFGGAAGPTDHARAWVVDLDRSEAAAAFVRALEVTPYAVVPSDLDDATEAVRDGRTAAALVLPEGFGAGLAAGAPRLGVLTSDDGSEPGALEARARVVAAALAANAPPAGAAVERSSPQGAAPSGAYAVVRMVFGMFALFVFTALLTRAGGVLDERTSGRLGRIVAMGVPYRDVLASHGVSLLVIGVVQALVLIVVTGAFGVPWGEVGWAIVLPVVAATLIAATGLGILVASLVRTPLQVQVWGFGMPMVLGMLGGAFGTLDTAPAGLQQGARISPQFWSMDALARGALSGTPEAMAVPIAVLVAVGTLGLVVGVQILRRSAP